MKNVRVKFLGASGTVTGSKFYLETPELNIMIDCGMFQGLKELRKKNWEPLSIDAGKIDVVLLTHGHLDHTGYLPRLVKEGFNGDIIGTSPTLAVARVILLDSAKIQEEQAKKANEEGFSKHPKALPFYNIIEAEKTITLFSGRKRDEWNQLSENIRFKYRYNGHIIGSTFIELEIFGKIFVFSGDVGRLNDELLMPPERPEWADYLFLESTYGNKLHPKENITTILSDLVQKTINDRATLIIPSFAVERLQLLMFLFWDLYKKNKIPNIPIFIDSPMGSNVLDVFGQFTDWHKLDQHDFKAMCNHFTITSSYADTWKTIDDPRPKIVIAGSGMVTGGRVLTYLKQLIDEPKTKVLLVGYQAEGTRGRQLLAGTHELKLFGKYYPVKASIHFIESLSAHADQAELLHFINGIKNIPENVFLIHGEPGALDAFKVKIRDTKGWNCHIPKLEETIDLLL
ncbi:MBL fold metallo-hydrolase RNA specificity domain-containing protein [Maribacter ulvicola]|uniref:Metallo-beta-lactamase family protein n=1 Tax=Maribacter ulvicola TaxID=228959 RepID=A0A1N6Z3L5_9FLAO|nr:MBL fold metallo-hydrolase [Maribacter ulvicola]SIR21395.1 metallo-beta-lactamase family protein [Maribacter ulvicola]